MKAGIVYYHRKANSLFGKWSHTDFGGTLADEVVHEIESCATEGKWPVDIYAPDGTLMFKGHLESVRLGQSLKLEWTGRFTTNDTTGRFVGLGVIIDDNLIAATFEQVNEED
jgi:hypothetical protein